MRSYVLFSRGGSESAEKSSEINLRVSASPRGNETLIIADLGGAFDYAGVAVVAEFLHTADVIPIRSMVVRGCGALPDDSPWARGVEALPSRRVGPDGRNPTYRLSACLARTQPSGVICKGSHFDIIAQRPSPHRSRRIPRGYHRMALRSPKFVRIRKIEVTGVNCIPQKHKNGQSRVIQRTFLIASDSVGVTTTPVAALTALALSIASFLTSGLFLEALANLYHKSI